MDDYVVNEPTVPYYVHEGIVARNERTVKRLIIAIIIAIVLMFASNALWLYEWSQYDYESAESVSTDLVRIDSKDGIANYIGNDGDINNGEYNSRKSTQKKDKDEKAQEREKQGN